MLQIFWKTEKQTFNVG